MSQLNPEIRKAIEAQDVDKARQLIAEALVDANADTYYLAALVPLDEQQKREFLQKALIIDPFHREAYKALNALTASTSLQAQEPKPSASPAVASFNPPQANPEPSPSPAVASFNPPQANPEPALAPNPKAENQILPEASQVPDASANTTSPINAPLQVMVVGPEAYLYRTPEKQRRGRELIPSGTNLDVLARDYDPKWINVGFKLAGETKIGWIESANLNRPKQRGGKEWNFDALPVTHYQYNTQKELKQIEKNIKSRNSMKGLGAIIAAPVVAFFVLAIAVSISQDYGAIIGGIVSWVLIIGSFYLRANNIAPLIRQINVLQRLQKTALSYVPSRYVAYTGWAHPLPEQIAFAEQEYEIDRQKSRQGAIRNAGIFALIGGGWLVLLFIGSPDEGSVNFAVFAIGFLALLLASPVIDYFAVYASDQERAMALVGVATVVAILAVGATKAQGGAIERRKEQEEAAAKARADAEKQEKEAQEARKKEEARKQKERQQQLNSQAPQQQVQAQVPAAMNYDQWRNPWGSGRMLNEREYEREHDRLRSYADQQAGKE